MTEQESTGFWLSPQQERTWLSGRRTAASVVFIEEPVESEALQVAVAKLVRRHEPLRTVFHKVPGMKAPFQIVLEDCHAGWREAPADTVLADLLAQDWDWDLEHGPVLQATHLRIEPARHALVLAVPSLVLDVPSFHVLARELVQILRGEELPEIPVRYVQIAQWQKDLLESEEPDAVAGRDYWSKVVCPPTPALPGERSGEREYQFAAVVCDLPFAPSKEVALAAWQSLLWRLTGQSPLPVDVFTENRGYDELHDAVGVIGKYIPVAGEFVAESCFEDVVKYVDRDIRAAEKFQDYFAPPATADSISFDYDDSDVNSIASPAGKLHLSVRRNRANIFFDASRLGHEFIGRCARYYETLLQGAVASPAMPVAALPILDAGELAQFEIWNETGSAYPDAVCLHELFEIQAAKTPDLPAVRCMELQLTYRELNEEANRLARRLQRVGVGPGRFVGLCVDRSVGMIAALLAVAKAGAAFVPLNSDNPKPRLAQQLLGITALITTENLRSALPECEASVVLLDRPDWHAEDVVNLGRTSGPEDLMYVIYTSGSTGLPKGVGVRHRNLVNYAWFVAHRLKGENLRFATVSTLSADLGNTCIYPSLISGGCLHVIPADTAGDGRNMAAYCEQYPIDVLKIVPSHLTALLDTADGRDILPRCHLICGGEALTWALVDRIREFAPACEIWNHYGPTETTVGSLMINLREAARPSLPIGRPIANTQIYILNEHRQPAPVGVAGELYIGGAGVTAGYVGQPERTAERFIDGMYRTGDLARFLDDGTVEFLGRADDQVKIRGFRIEPGEIEAALIKHPDVRHAVVMAREGNGETYLVAYLVRRESALDLGAVRSYLRQQLPEYMIPSVFVPVPRVPLTPNGKIDRQALPSAEQGEIAGREYAAATSEAEKAVAAIWETVMRNTRIGVEDDFFDIGGHSLLATQIASRLREHFRMPVAVRLIFEYPTIRQLAARLETYRADAEDEFDIIPITRAH